MALHDPESSAQEKAIALKIGRQKKIQVIDGQRVEVLTGESDEEEDPDLEPGAGLPMQGEDGQHYVVLEVIQLPDDGSGQTQGVVQLPGGSGEEFREEFSHQNIAILPSILEHTEPTMMETEVSQEMSQEQIRIKKEEERAKCFGFDEYDDDD